MHIVFVTTELATSQNSSGGLASFTANMARLFAANGHQVTILLVTTKEEKLEFDENILLITTFVKKKLWDVFDKISRICACGNTERASELRKFSVNIFKSVQVRNRIEKINKQKKVDIVHYCNLSAMAFQANRKIPYVIRISSFINMCNGANTCRGDIDYKSNKRSIRDKLVDNTLKKARYVISPSKLLADVGREELRINPVVIESPFVLNRSDWNYDVYNTKLKGKKYILHFGSLKYLKGTHIVAQLANEFLRTHTDYYLVLAGNSEYLFDRDGNRLKADEFVKKSAGEFADRVIYLGRLVREQLYPVIQKACLCLLPSRIDNLPNTCIEAMALGKIVVGTNGASYEQLIDDRVSGFLCERDNAASYLNAVNEALDMSEESRRRMIEKAVARIKRLSPDVIYREYLEFYEKVIREW